ncbi:hypothetical protein NIES2107_46890 [Nostoc carneum NIES-2107]|nr:hypothetical protein NIES2107_46890 [Nostoc carneum NIES-2107]
MVGFKSAVGTSISINSYCWYIPFFVLKDNVFLKQFLDALAWVIDKIKSL